MRALTEITVGALFAPKIRETGDWICNIPASIVFVIPQTQNRGEPL